MPMVGSDKVIFAYRRNKMTRELTIRSLDIPSIHKIAVGFDNLFDELNRLSSAQTQNYPPHNVIKHTDDRFTIEVAVAGFKEGEVSITLEKNILTITGEKVISLDAQPIEYVHRGISSRSFVRQWPLAEYVEVISAEIEDGILSIELERKVPDEQKPKSIAIKYNK